jgi:hypothetical protein
MLEIPGSSMAVAPVYVGPQTVNSVNLQSRFCELMPSAVPIGSKLDIYAALAEIPPRPDGGLPRPSLFCSAARWHVLVGYIYSSMEISPSPSWQYYCPEARACNLYPPDITVEITIHSE